MEPVLFGYPASGHAWKVRQALVLLGIEHRYAFVDLAKPRQERRADFIALSPYGEVPILKMGNNVYAQSNAILLMLARETGGLAGSDTHTLERWLFWEANRIGFSVANLRWEINFAEEPSSEVVAMLRSRAEADLAFLDLHLEDRLFVINGGLSMADLACSAYLQFAEEAGLDLTIYPNVSRWLSNIATSPLWETSYSLLARDRENC